MRHRDPQYQTKWRLALRELFVHKRLSIVMMILWMIITIYYTCGIMNPQTTFSIHQSNPIDFHYLEYYPSSKREKDHLEALHLDQTMTYTYTMIEINQEEMTVGSLDHINLLKKSCIQGRVPIQENEIILLKHSDGNLTDLFKGYNIGDSLIMKGKEYQIVGFLLPNQVSTQDSFVVHDIYYMCDYDVYVLPQTFDILSQGKEYYHMRTYFELEDRENIEKKIRKHLYFDCINCSDDFFSSSLTGVAVFSDIDPLILMIPFIVCVCFCYFFNRNDLMIHHHDYDLYHLIGMTKQDILKKELWKAVFMTGVNMMVQLIWIIFINISYQIIMLPILEFLSTTLIVFVVTSLIYCLPLYSLFKYSNQEGSAKYV